MSVSILPAALLLVCGAVAFASMYVIAKVAPGVRPLDQELMQSKTWPEFKKWNARLLDWFWRGALHIFAWMGLSFSTAIVLVVGGEMLGVMTPGLGGFIVTVAVVVTICRMAMFWLEDISALWKKK